MRSVSAGTRALSLAAVLMLCLAGLLCLAPRTAAEPVEYLNDIPSLPYTIAGAATIEHDGMIYVMGGFPTDIDGIEAPYARVIAYDTATHEVEYKAPLLTGVGLAAHAKASNGLFYVIGGWNWSFGYISAVQVYNPANNTWWQETNAPTPVGAGQAVATDEGSVFVFGSTPFSTNSTLVYDTAAKTWSYASDQPSSLWPRCAVLYSNDAIYVIGGRSGGSVVANVDVYNPTTDSWTSASSMPIASILGGAGLAANGYIYYVGGTSLPWPSSGASNSAVQRYDPVEDDWVVAGVGLSSPRAALGTVVDDHGRMFVVGGDSADVTTSAVSLLLTVDVVRDEVSITAPADGSVVNGVVTVTVAANNIWDGIYTLEVHIDDVLVWSTYGVWWSTTFSFTWDTSALPDLSTHDIVAYGYMWDGQIKEDSVTVTVWADSVEEMISAIEQDIADVQAQLLDLQDQLLVQDANLSALSAQVAILQAQLTGLQAALVAMAAGSEAAMAELNATLTATLTDLQAQLDDFQEQIDRIETKADSGGTLNMVTLVLVIVVIALLALMFMMARKKP